MAEVQARLGIAKHLDALHQTDHAIENLRAVVALKPDAPYAALPLAWLRLGEAHDRLGNRVAATDAYAAAIESSVTPDPYNVRVQAAERLRRAPDARRAEAYRLSLDGFRRLERNDLSGAAAALSQSLALNGADPVARYRYGRVLQARRDDAAGARGVRAGHRGGTLRAGADRGDRVPRRGAPARARRASRTGTRLLSNRVHATSAAPRRRTPPRRARITRLVLEHALIAARAGRANRDASDPRSAVARAHRPTKLLCVF